MNNNTLSVVLVVRNEESNLGRCLESIKSIADEIIVCDEASTDHTIAIAKKYGAKIIHSQHLQNFHINKNRAIDAASKDWVLQLDADEVVSSELSIEIKQVISLKSSVNGYWLNRRNWFLYRFLTKGGQYPDPTLRLYRRGTGRLPAKDVHEQAVVQGKTSQLKNDLLHYRDINFTKYLQGFDRYSSFIAINQTRYQDILGYLLIKPVYIFLKLYIRHKGFYDGWAGFVFALFSGLIYPVAGFKFIKSKIK